MPTKGEKDAISGTETTGHEWDGIKELNTPLPRWWLYVFYATIAWSVVWWILYPAIPGITDYSRGILGYDQRAELRETMATARAAQAEFLERIAAASLEEIHADPDLRSFAIAGGRTAFADNCATCHGLGGSGQAGGYPVLADDDWLWGGTLDDIHETIRYGIRHEPAETRVSEMPAFGALEMLTPDQISDVAEHVQSLSGMSVDAAAAERGATIYAENCAMCHGENGQGDRQLGAPRLDDQIWLYGGEKDDIVRQVTRPAHGVMPAWGDRLSPELVKMLTVYVHTLGGGE
jgi:cytochrome c oxidase cbb3-type subunit 3